MSTFIGADFFVESAIQLGSSGIRVRFGHDPLASNPNGAHDALNIGQYSVVGPQGINLVVLASIVPDDPQSIDLALSVPLELGAYTVTVSSNLQTVATRPLQAPMQALFTVVFVGPTDDINGGATNDSAEATIRKHLPPSLAGRAWNALIAALAVGDKLNWDNAELAFDQLFKSSASGLYLDRNASDDGLQRPAGVGMPDDLFRQLAIKTTASKLTPEVLLEIMEIFYGSDSIRASATSGLAEPLVLADGDSLELLLDGQVPVTVSFAQADFTRINQASAEETAAAITRALRLAGTQAFAISFTDPATNTVKVRIYSGSLGLSSSVQITGGRAQLGLQLPALDITYSGSVSSSDNYNWVVTDPEPGTNRIQLTIPGGSGKVDLSTVQTGDYVVFEAANSSILAGVYPITDVQVFYSGSDLVQYLEIGGTTAAHSFLQLSNQEMTFFRPSRQTIHQSDSRTVVVAQTSLNQVDVRLPATTQAVGRGILTASYVHDTEPLALSGLQRLGSIVSVVTSSPHGLSVGDQIFVDEAYGSSTAPAVTAGDGVSTSDYSLATIFTELETLPVAGTVNAASILLPDGRLLFTGGAARSGYDSACLMLRVSAVTSHGSALQYTYHWDQPADLLVPRAYHGISLLQDGTVLVTGGFTGTTLASASIYTPVAAPGAGAWVDTNPMGTTRFSHGQVTLLNGKVLVTGGNNGTDIVASCEIWDPATSAWTAAASMTWSRGGHTATLLADGRVLVSGGNSDDSVLRAQAEIYDPGTNTWTLTGTAMYGRTLHTATLLADGRVTVIGGVASVFAGEAGSTTSDSIETWDPLTGRWARTGNLQIPREAHGAVYLPASNRIIIGGGGSDQSLEYLDVGTFKSRFVPNNPSDDLNINPILPVGNGLAVLIGSFSGSDDNAPSYLFQPGEDVYELGGLNGVFRVQAVSDNTHFSYKTPDYPGLTTNVSATTVIKPFRAVADEVIVGPYIFDPAAGIAITATATTTTADLFTGGQYAVLAVTDATAFPDETGWIVIGFGADTQVGPLKYLGKVSDESLLLDYSFRQTADNLAGASVTLLTQRGPFVPDHPETLGASYITASSSGRLAAITALESCLAAGITPDIDIVYPGDKGLGGAGLPEKGAQVLSDKVAVWGGDDITAELDAARTET